MPDRIETYEQAIEFLFGRINYERIQAEAYSTSDFKLDRMRRLLELMGNPHERIPAIHVAGTKGKGSTCSMLSSILAASGYRCGLYISPHITAFEERFTINGVMPTQSEFIGLVNRLLPMITQMDNMPGRMQPTYFELATALAWLHFLEQNVDIAVLEVGLGGRLDSTNLCKPLVTVITNVSRDHTHVLGSTVHQIAYEKAGIVKSGIPTISGVTHPDALAMVEETCRERGSPLKLLGRDFRLVDRHLDEHEQVQIDVTTSTSNWQQMPVALRGPHQAVNATLALAVVDELRQLNWDLSDDDVRQGLLSVSWPARVEVIARRPTVIVDAAHNWESARALVASLNESTKLRKRILVFAATKDKDVAGILRQLLPHFDTLVLTRYLDNPRGVSLEELSRLVNALTVRPAHLAKDPLAAWTLAKRLATQDDVIVITGSFFLVAELRSTIAEECRATLN
ncbi:bifunctional folylpolyglutamate synthase/dihydrofolate synthase [Schlesneria paludicola]|uniref:bifunctional folylpolyglutamate synthase/dihydrofolate synthase n=1 Tax=Schlesneria paludicola TaxID=360056 RepID=UPI00029A26E9|nr:folylpolyglutamate synthase/dihydrofolate synthase family protein [Schlesneria paludicola]